jgi:O-succinylbenzoic acid--CoA ligase
MTAETPYRWLSRGAADHPERPCLVQGIDELTYRDVLERVDTRVNEMRKLIQEWEIVPIPVRIDVDSVIEILAVQRAGGVPFPYIGRVPALPVRDAPDGAVCIETSGSSGNRKIVPLTYGNLRASVHASRNRLGNSSSDRWLVCLPLNHVGGLTIVWRTFEAGGTALVAPFDASGATIEHLRPTVASMVPTMVQRLLSNNPEALASIALVLVGGAALDRSVWDRCIRAGIHLVPTYGLTEAGSQVATADQDERGVPLGRAATPLDGMEVAIVGPDHEPVGTDRLGLISIDGPAVFDGYLGEEPRRGWFTTSDMGRLDADGNLHVEGRADDVIVSGGENVSLGRVAGAISGIDGIDDVCVVGIDGGEWGTVGGAMVVSRHALKLFDTMVEEALEVHERPKRWLVRDTIPRLANGKHDLAAVREAFEEEAWT